MVNRKIIGLILLSMPLLMGASVIEKDRTSSCTADSSCGLLVEGTQLLSMSKKPVKLLSLEVKDKVVKMDWSKEILAYKGGTATEYALGAYFMEWAFKHTDAEVLVVTIEGKTDLFPEGSDYSWCTTENYGLYYKDEKALGWLREVLNENNIICDTKSRQTKGN